MHWNEKKRLKSRLNALIAMNGSPDHIKSVKAKLALMCFDIKDAFNHQLDRKETLAVEKIM